VWIEGFGPPKNFCMESPTAQDLNLILVNIFVTHIWTVVQFIFIVLLCLHSSSYFPEFVENCVLK